ncbi:O-methyltransferase, partial [Arthrobacter sp. JCM 19049]|uniref:O-methyltransferase n=1 Tax=Arthrobacter sp. JCM 19049 TaxID=1460643 RepID=UPI000AC3E161
ARARIITERAATVLGRLTDRAYDMVLIDAEHENLLDYVAEAKRLIGKRGVIIICNAFDEHRLAKPAVRKAPRWPCVMPCGCCARTRTCCATCCPPSRACSSRQPSTSTSVGRRRNGAARRGGCATGW